MQINIKHRDKKEDIWEIYLDMAPAHVIFLKRFSGMVDGKGGLHRAVSIAYDLAEALECSFKVIKKEG